MARRMRATVAPRRAAPALRRRQSEPSEASEGPAEHILRLQETAGNTAVTELIQRQEAEAPPKRKNEPFLKRGYSGSGVKKLQQRLNAQGTEPPLKIDGDFGRKTHDAVVEFQTTHELEPDGKVGKFTWEALDKVAETPEIEPTEEQLGAHAKAGMDYVNDINGVNPQTIDRGVHYSYNYKDTVEKAGRAELWKDDYRDGYADPQYFVRLDFMDWRLKPGMSASAALKAWLHGLTIAECNSALIAIEIDAVRASMGDAKFDEQFGSTDKSIPEKQRLRIKSGKTDTLLEGLLKPTAEALATDKGTKNNRPARPGDWVYFFNHPKYLLKHPGGAWQGENALYEGRDESGAQRFSGMGAPHKTEDDLLQEMFEDYNRDRDAEDEVWFKAHYPEGPPPMYELKEDGTGEFPVTLSSIAQIEAAPEYELNGRKRKGGFVAWASKRLDPEAVKALSA